MTDWNTIYTLLAVVIAGAALGWKIIDFILSQKGSMVLRLACQNEHTTDEDYIIASTSLENTGRKSITIDSAYLLLIYSSSKGDLVQDGSSERDTNHDEAIKNIYQYQSGKELEKGKISPQKFKDIFSELKSRSKDKEIHNGDATVVFRFLPYYTEFHSRLGGLAYLSTQKTIEIQRRGIWSIYFGAVGEKWFREMLQDKDAFYSAHQELIVPLK